MEKKLGLPVLMTHEVLFNIVSEFKNKKIAVLGDVGIDRYTQGSVDRISPEAPVPIVLVQKEFLKLGLAANVADNIIALGGKAELSGVVGADEDGKSLLKLLTEKALPVRSLVRDPSRRTILKERIVAETQQMLRVDYESTHALASSIQKKVLKSILASIKNSDALIIEDYAKGLLNQEMIGLAIKTAKKKKIPVLIDPHVKTPISWYRGATLLTPNKREAEGLAGEKITDRASLLKAGEKIMLATEAESLVITLGKDGMAIFVKNQDSKSKLKKPTVFHIPTFAREVYDVSGAGDTVISVLALALSEGIDLERAAYVSNLAAGVEVSKRGTATVSPQEIMQAYQVQV